MVEQTSFDGGATGLALIADPFWILATTRDVSLMMRLGKLVASGGHTVDVLEELAEIGLRSVESFVVVERVGSELDIALRGSGQIATDEGVSADADGERPWRRMTTPFECGFTMQLGTSLGDAFYCCGSGIVPSGSLKWPADWLSQSDADRDADEMAVSVSPDRDAGAYTALPDDEPQDRGERSLTSTTATSDSMAIQDHEPLSSDTLHPADYNDVDASVTPRDDVAVRDMNDPFPPAATESPTDSHERFNYDSLFGLTQARSVQDAAVDPVDTDQDDERNDRESLPRDASRSGAPIGPGERPESDRVAGPPVEGLISQVPSSSAPVPATAMPDETVGDSDGLGDHDGMTIAGSILQSLREQSAVASPGVALAGGPAIRAVLCPSEHANPTELTSCRVCGSGLGTTPVLIPRPSLGRLELSIGAPVELARPAVLGRNPRIEGKMTGEVPQTVRLDAGNGLSRSHAMIRLEGWQVFIEDLRSANGTIVTNPGRPPLRLRSGQPTLLEDGATIDLGGEVSATYRAAQS